MEIFLVINVFQVIFELIATERDYVGDLFMITEHFLKPIKEKHLLPREDIGHLFLNIETLCTVNAEFLKDLEALQVREHLDLIF